MRNILCKYAVVILLACFCNICSAQTTITIGNGTGSTTSQPIGTFYSYSASEMIYLSSEMGTTMNITTLAFDKASGTSTQEINDVKIYMKKTTLANYGTGVVKFNTSLDGYTLVWAGNFPNSGTGWQQVTLNTPFQYDDLTKNLAVLVLNNSGAAIASGRPQYRYTTTSPAKENGNFGDLNTVAPWTPADQLTPVWERANVRFGSTPLASCINPSALSAGNITTTSATVSWTGFPANSPNGFDWEVRTTGAGGSGTAGLITNGSTAGSISTANVTGLSAGVNYKLYVRAKCTSGTSPWTGPYDFTTLCETYPLPFTEGFNSNIRPSCWSQNFVAGPLSIDFTYPPTGTTPSANAFEGSNMLLFSSNTIAANTQMRLVSPALNTSGVNSVDVEFEWFHSQELPNYPDKLSLQYSLDGTIWLAVPDGTIDRWSNTVGWSHKTITLPAGAANKAKVYVGLLFISGFGYNCYVDNIQIKKSGITCREPMNVSVADITERAVKISWTAPPIAPANGYEWKIVNAGAGSGGTAVKSGLTANTTVTVSDLPSASHSYSIFVRSVCDDANSVWTSPADFTTACAVFDLPFKEDFKNNTVSFPPPCWAISNTQFIKPSDISAYNAGTGSLLFYNFAATHGNYEVVLPVTQPVTDGYYLLFNYAHAGYSLGDYSDGLTVAYSTNGGSSYTTLQSYTSAILSTAAAVAQPYSPRAASWNKAAIALPAGTNRVKLTDVCNGGNNIFIDNIEIKIPEKRVSIYPNPASSFVVVDGVDMSAASLVVRDVLGRKLITVKGRNAIDISALPAAVYLVTIYAGSETFTQKLVVNR